MSRITYFPETFYNEICITFKREFLHPICFHFYKTSESWVVPLPQFYFHSRNYDIFSSVLYSALSYVASEAYKSKDDDNDPVWQLYSALPTVPKHKTWELLLRLPLYLKIAINSILLKCQEKFHVRYRLHLNGIFLHHVDVKFVYIP